MTEEEWDAPEGGNFEGIRVVDFTHILAGPYCTKLMADMGAEVIKVEPPVTGERGRTLPYVKNGASGFYMWRNAGKKSLCLDMKQPASVEVFKDLVRVSDVVVQNRNVGVVERLGIGYADLKKINPKLVMCSISGFGRTGPMARWPGGDAQIQAMSGALYLTGHADGPPLPSWVPWVDFATGTHSLGAVSAALFYRDRKGKGQHIDVSMLDCAFSYHCYAVEEYLLTDGEVRHTRTGTMHPNIALIGVYECRDGYILMSSTNDSGWGRLIELLDRPELATDPRFDTGPHRNENRDEVNRVVSEWIKDYDVNEAKMLLDHAGVLATPILSVEEIINHPQIEARKMLVDVEDPRVGKFKQLSTPFKFSETKAEVRGRAPLLGEHNEEILDRILGYGDDRIAQLRESRVIYAEADVSRLLNK